MLEGLAPVYVAGKKTVTGSGGRRLSDRSDTGSVPTCRPDRRSAARPRRCSNTGTHRDSPGPRPGLCHIPGRGCTRRRRSSNSTSPLPRGSCGSAGGLAEPLRQVGVLHLRSRSLRSQSKRARAVHLRRSTCAAR